MKANGKDNLSPVSKIANKQVIRKIARIRDDATGQYVEIIEFKVAGDKTARLELPPAVVHDIRQLRDKLWNAGAVLPADPNERDDLLRTLADSEPPKELVYAAETGWLDEKWEAFVEIDGVIGKAPTIIGVKRADDIHDPTGQVSKSGTAESWSCIAERARQSSILMLAICAAFAAPLLSALRYRSFGINFFGKSRIGKTIATLIGASVRGIGKVEDLISWAITEARLEQRLPEFKDSLFPIDDLMKMGGRDREKYQRARDLAYLIEQGHQTARHSAFTKQHGGAHRRYLSILLTSCEFSIAELAQGSKLERLPGQAVRLIDQPALLDGRDHIFDRQTQDMNVEEFTRWKVDMFSDISRDCAANHGAVFERHIESLIHHGREKISTYVQRRIAEFTNHVGEQTDGDIARDIAGKFGLLYGAGRLAIKLKLVPWTKEELLDAITKCYLAARDLLPDTGVALRRGIQALKQRLQALPERSELPQGAQYKDLDGYRTREAAYRCIIKREAFNAIFPNTSDRALVLDWLLQKRIITTAESRKAGPGSSPKPKEQFDWPDGKRRRSYEIRLPRVRAKSGKRVKATSKKESEQ
jgi:hypothetical protein